jgi:hypothetical protein
MHTYKYANMDIHSFITSSGVPSKKKNLYCPQGVGKKKIGTA